MTTTASPDSLDPAADRQTRRTDELEHWLTDLRTNLNQDPPDWPGPQGDADDAAGGQPSPPPKPGRDPTGPRGGTPASPNDPNRRVIDAPPGPAVGRHRAAD